LLTVSLVPPHHACAKVYQWPRIAERDSVGCPLVDRTTSAVAPSSCQAPHAPRRTCARTHRSASSASAQPGLRRPPTPRRGRRVPGHGDSRNGARSEPAGSVSMGESCDRSATDACALTPPPSRLGHRANPAALPSWPSFALGRIGGLCPGTSLHTVGDGATMPSRSAFIAAGGAAPHLNRAPCAMPAPQRQIFSRRA
jgi:hypothetical protein